MDLSDFMSNIESKSMSQINRIHRLSKRLWLKDNRTPADIQNKCLNQWDYLKDEIASPIIPLIPVYDDRPTTNLIFGSGSFSTGLFQVIQYEKVANYAQKPPIRLNGIVSNKSTEHGCNGKKVALSHQVPYVEFDFIDWYHEYIDHNEPNPIRATRYWYSPQDNNRPSISEIKTRFKIRQNQYHRTMSEHLDDTFQYPTDIVSARGYNFQFCSNIFRHQGNHLPHINDTHPADLRYIDPNSNEKLYAGWQAGAVELMMRDQIHERYRGSLIEVNYMDSVRQIHELDEGALLAIGTGVAPDPALVPQISSKNIQTAMKVMDDYLFCTLEPTGMLFAWGITEKKIPVKYITIEQEVVEIPQHAIVVGNKVYSGMNAWGLDFEADFHHLRDFLKP